MLMRLRQPRALLVAMHLPFVAFTAGLSITGLGWEPPGIWWSALPLVLIAGALQVRHSLAAAEGIRPRYWEWTLLSLLLITYLPTPVFLLRWTTLHWYLNASLLMLLPERLALAAAVTDAVGLSVWYTLSSSSYPGAFDIGSAKVAWYFVYSLFIQLSGAGSLYGAARLVWHAKELREMRAEL